MNILFVTIAWPKKGGDNLYSDLMGEFRDKGHKISVACSTPKRDGLETHLEVENGCNVLRIKTGNISKTGHFEKFFSLLRLNGQFNREVRKYYGDKKFDLIIFNTPPITMSGVLKKLKNYYNSNLYLLLKDIWPYGFADLGVIKRGGLAWKYFRYHEKRIYEIADTIGCMSAAGVAFVLNKNPWLDAENVEVCPNSASVKGEVMTRDNSIRQKYNIPECATVFLFSGNIGKGHGVDFLIEAIKMLENYDKAFFLIGGAGTHHKKVKKALEDSRAKNSYVYNFLPDEDFNRLLSICDVGLILLDRCYTYPQFPSRLLAYLKSQMAVLCAINRETDIGDIVENAGAGLQLNHGDLDAFMDAVINLSTEKEKTAKMGRNAYKLLKDNYLTEHSYEIIMKYCQE